MSSKKSKIDTNVVMNKTINTYNTRSNIQKQEQQQQQKKQKQIKYTSLTKYEDQPIKGWSISDSFNSTTLKLLFDIKVILCTPLIEEAQYDVFFHYSISFNV